MFKYILKRLLLMVPTFFGTTLMVFSILAIVPGGPFEKAVMQLKQQGTQGGEVSGGSAGVTDSGQLTPEVLEKLRKQFGLDKPMMVRYFIWLGLYPRETKDKTVKIGEPFRENVEYVKKGNTTYEIQKWVRAEKQDDGSLVIAESGVGSDFKFSDEYDELPSYDQIGEWYESNSWEIKNQKEGEVNLVQTAFSGIFTGDLGTSYVYHEPVSKLIWDRLHISAYFGIISFILTYLICIPLGIWKGVKNGSMFDMSTSALIFIGYSIPGFVLGAVLLVLFGGGSFWDVFPLGGFRSPNYDELGFFSRILDQIHHTFLPMICYMVGSFATLTILMKNSLLENLGQDYVRTAFAKGLPEKVVIFSHALRNSLIPIAAGIGGIIGVFLAGSYLIEKVFNIHGIGLLGYEAIVKVDYPVFLGFLVISIVTRILGNLISDLAYVLVDPRIKLD